MVNLPWTDWEYLMGELDVPIVATHSSPFPGACLTTAGQELLNVNPDAVQVSLWDSPGLLTTASDWIKVWQMIPVEERSSKHYTHHNIIT